MPAIVAAFLILHTLQNVWRPVLVALFDRSSEERHLSTLLSVDSQARRLVTVALAPPLGIWVDLLRARGDADVFWPLGAVGLAIALAFGLIGILGGRRYHDSETV
jgi:hypothetical protein